MQRIKAVILYLIGLPLFFALVILPSVKSKPGNPTLDELNSSAWQRSGPLELSPERARYALLYSLAENRSFQFTTEIARLATPDLGYKKGQFVSLFAPGTSLLMLPGYLIGKLHSASHLGATLMISLFALFNCLLLFSISRALKLTPLISLLVALTFLIATPAYAYAGVIYQHHPSTFLLLAVLRLALSRPSYLKLGLAAFCLSSSLIIDYPNLFFIAPLMLYFTLRLRIWHPKFLLVILLGILPLVGYFTINYYSYGSGLQLSNTVTHIQALDAAGQPMLGQGADARARSDLASLESRERNALNFFKSRHLLNGFYAFFISPDRGIWYYAPILFLGFVGLLVLSTKNPHLAQALVGVVLFNLLLYSMRSDPWGGWAFGGRYLIPSYAILALGIGWLLNTTRRLIWLPLFLLLSSYSIAVNTLGAVTSIANPPQVEVLSLEALSGNQERYSYDRNLSVLVAGKSKSYLYNTFLATEFSALNYYRYLSLTLIGLYSFGLIWHFVSRRRAQC